MRAHAASQVYESPLFYQYLSMYSSDCFQGREGEEQSVLPTNYLSFAHVLKLMCFIQHTGIFDRKRIYVFCLYSDYSASIRGVMW